MAIRLHLRMNYRPAIDPTRLKSLGRGLLRCLVGGLMILATGSCSVGPSSIKYDQFNYSNAISTSWKNQILVNIVKLAYADVPVFLNISSIINQYELEGSATADFLLAPGPDSSLLGGSIRYVDRPTIVYTPLAGESFTERLMTPVAPAAILALFQSGWPIDWLFPLAVQAVNGVQNSTRGMMNRRADPGFLPAVAAFRQIQEAGDVRLHTIEEADGMTTLLEFIDDPESGPSAVERQIQQILNLDPSIDTYRIVFSPIQESNAELAIHTRSIIEMLIELSSFMDRPESHVAKGYIEEIADDDPAYPPLIHIQTSTKEPGIAYAKAKYLDHWFWIDHSDIQSKISLTIMLFFFSLTQTEGGENEPVVTIPTG